MIIDKEKVIRLLDKTLNIQLDKPLNIQFGNYSWDEMVADIDDLTDEEKSWAKKHVFYRHDFHD